MFTQAGAAVRDQAATLLGGLRPKRLIASGESQSAGRMVTYINAIHPLAHVYQGFLVHSRGSGGSPLSQTPFAAVPTPNPAIIRTDNPTPTIVLQSETDVNEGARQDDSPTFRLWEMAGTSHVDAPVAVGTDQGQSGPGLICRLVGATFPFDAARLASLYKSHDQFVNMLRTATHRAVAAGFLLAVDARGLVAAASQSAIPG